MKLSVIVPVFNERETIAEVMEAVRAVTVHLPDGRELEKEIILIDDGSTDGSGAVLDQYQGDALVLRHDSNRGKGAALRTGFQQASGDIVLIHDSDMEYDPEEYPRLLEPILKGRADVVYGSRLSGGRPQHAFLFWHLAGNRLLSLLTNVLYNTTLSDMETGYKVFRLEVVENFRLRTNDFRVEVEMTAQVLKNRKLRLYQGAYLLLRKIVRRGKENHLARWLTRDRNSHPLSILRLTSRTPPHAAR